MRLRMFLLAARIEHCASSTRNAKCRVVSPCGENPDVAALHPGYEVLTRPGASAQASGDQFLEDGVRLLLLLGIERDRHHLSFMQRLEHAGRIGLDVRPRGNAA